MEYKLYKYRWTIVAAFWIVIFAYGANWFALSPMLKTFEADFNIPSWESHLLISLIGMFVVFFAWPAGTLIDKRGPKISTSIGALFMAIGFGVRPWLLDSFYALLLSSVIAGIGLAWILVAMAPQMFRWFPHKQASLPVGIVASGLFIGFGTGSLVMPILVDAYNKSTGFLIFGIIAIIAFFIWIVVAKDHPQTPPEERIKVEKMKFAEGMKKVLTSKNAFLYPIIGFLIVGITLVISSFIHSLYSTTAVIKAQGGYIAGLLLYGCAIGAFTAPFIMKKIGLKKITLAAVSGAVVLWLVMFGLFAMNNYDVTSISWMLIALIAFLFGVCFQASWPLALYSQETEDGVTEANVGISASLYISVSNIGAAVLPVVFPLVFITSLANFIAIFAGLFICLLIWAIVKRK
ncbi:MAG: MFS transporter [Euryarchaeota archaeon]|nr:MFS transporter [Euryarchaeota archaeon]